MYTRNEKGDRLSQTFGLPIIFDPRDDGSCQYAAVAHQLEKIGIFRSSETLRAETVDYLSITPCLAQSVVPWSNSVIIPPQEYLQDMRNSQVYGDQVTLHAMSEIFNVQILVVSEIEHGTTLIHPAGQNILSSDIPLIILGNFPEGIGEHYVSLGYDHQRVRTIIKNSPQIYVESDYEDQNHSDRDNAPEESVHDIVDDRNRSEEIKTIQIVIMLLKSLSMILLMTEIVLKMILSSIHSIPKVSVRKILSHAGWDSGIAINIKSFLQNSHWMNAWFEIERDNDVNWYIVNRVFWKR